MTDEVEPCIRLWQSVALQAITDAVDPGYDRQREARRFVESSAFAGICELTDLSVQVIREGLDDPDLYSRIRQNTQGRLAR